MPLPAAKGQLFERDVHGIELALGSGFAEHDDGFGIELVTFLDIECPGVGVSP